MDDIYKNLGEKEKEIKAEYDKSQAEKRQETFAWIKSLIDWKKLPLDLLFYSILAVGAVLMYLSIYSFTKNVFVSIFSVAFSEAGIVGWKIAADRAKNTVKQLEIAKGMRDWHIYSSVALLVANLVIDSAQTIIREFGFKVDGFVWIVLGIIAVTAYRDLTEYIAYQDNDREGNQKRSYAEKIATLTAETTGKQLDAQAEAKRIESEALVEYMKQNAPEIAKLSGKLEAARKIKEMYTQMGLTPEEVDALLSKIEKPSHEKDGGGQTEKEKSRTYNRTGKYSQNKNPKLTQAEKESKENESQDPFLFQ
jgi:hypothetical protein